MERISQEVYEAVKTQVLAEIEEQKVQKRRIDLEAEAVFGKAKYKYMQKLADKYGPRYDGTYFHGHGCVTADVHEIYKRATQLALEDLGMRTAREAYLNGLGDEANRKAEQILEAILKQ